MILFNSCLIASRGEYQQLGRIIDCECTCTTSTVCPVETVAPSFFVPCPFHASRSRRCYDNALFDGETILLTSFYSNTTQFVTLRAGLIEIEPAVCLSAFTTVSFTTTRNNSFFPVFSCRQYLRTILGKVFGVFLYDAFQILLLICSQIYFIFTCSSFSWKQIRGRCCQFVRLLFRLLTSRKRDDFSQKVRPVVHTYVSISMRTFLRRDDEARVLIESTLGRGTHGLNRLCSLDLRRSRAL